MQMSDYESNTKPRGPEEMADHWEPGQLDDEYNKEMLVRVACARCPWFCIIAGLCSRLGNSAECVNQCVSFPFSLSFTVY